MAAVIEENLGSRKGGKVLAVGECGLGACGAGEAERELMPTCRL